MQQQPAETAQGRFDASLYDRFAATIFTYLLSQVQNEQDAQDLLLEVFLAALGNELLSSLPEERQLAWLRSVARNKVVDRYRHVTLLTFLPLEQVMETIDDQGVTVMMLCALETQQGGVLPLRTLLHCRIGGASLCEDRASLHTGSRPHFPLKKFLPFPLDKLVL